MRSWGTSIPRSPRATITPSATSRISSMLSTPSWFSILAIILMSLWCSSRMARISSTSCLLRTNEWAMKSISFSIAYKMLLRSFSVSEGRLIRTPGTLTLLRLPRVASLHTSQYKAFSSLSVTTKPKSPSSISTCAPTERSRTKLGYDTHIHSRVVSCSGLPTMRTLSPIL